MFDGLLEIVKETASEKIGANPLIPFDRKEEAFETTASTLTSGLRQIVSAGLPGGLASFLQPSAMENITNQLIGMLGQSFSSKFGFGVSEAGGLAGSIVPSVLQGLIQKAMGGGLDISSLLGQAKSAGFDVDGIAGSLLGNKNKGSGGVMDALEGMF